MMIFNDLQKSVENDVLYTKGYNKANHVFLDGVYFSHFILRQSLL
jgi:hypothetical protein